MEQVTIIGIDLAKHSFQLHGAHANGSVAFRRKLSRGKLLDFLASQPRCAVAMEACASAHYWGRETEKLGHEVKLIPPIYVKPFVKRHKNDTTDAEAICEAAQRPTMSVVAVKSEGLRALEREPHPRHAGLGRRKPRHRVGARAHGKRVGFCSQRRPLGPAVEQNAANAQRSHREVHVRAHRRLALRRQRQRPLAVSRHSPHRDPLGERVACVGEERGQRRGDLAASVRRAVAALALGVREHQPRNHRIAREVGAHHRARHLTVEGELALAPVEARHRAPAPERGEAPLRRPAGEREGRAGQHLAPRERARPERQGIGSVANLT